MSYTYVKIRDSGIWGIAVAIIILGLWMMVAMENVADAITLMCESKP